MSWISFDHSACFCEVHLQALYLGSDQVFVTTADLIQEPWRFFQVLSTHKIGYTFTPNFFLAAAVESLSKQGPETLDLDLSHLSVIMCGGEANRTETLEAADKALRKHNAPPCTFKAAYGLSETCSACFYNLQSPAYDLENGNTFATVGEPMPGLSMKIVGRGEDQDSPDEGIVHLRGEVLFKGYHGNPDATAACMTEDGWMSTGDIGRLDRNGNLELLGRAKEVLILNGNNYSSFEIEYAIETAGITGLTPTFTAVFSTWSKERNSEAPVVLFNPTEGIDPQTLRSTIKAIRSAVFRVCSQQPLYVVPLRQALLPKSTIGKLSRAKLRQSFEKGEFDQYIFATSDDDQDRAQSLDDLSPLGKEILQIYASIMDITAMEDLLGDGALSSSGINSLGFIRLKKALETKLKIHKEVPIQVLTQCHSFAQLEHELTLLGAVPQEYDPVVTLVEKGSRQPLFLLHSFSGDTTFWTNILRYLPDRPIHALRPKGLYEGEGTFENLQDILDTYYAAMRRIQSDGPYAMLGIRFGGLLCFELGKRFEANGLRVAFCGITDVPPCMKGTIGHASYRSVLLDLMPVVCSLSAEAADVFAKEAEQLNDEQFYDALFMKISPEFAERMGLKTGLLKGLGRVEDSLRSIAVKYVPEGVISTADIFCARPVAYSDDGKCRKTFGEWSKFTTSENAMFRDVQSTHLNLLGEPAVEKFAKVLNEALEGRGL